MGASGGTGPEGDVGPTGGEANQGDNGPTGDTGPAGLIAFSGTAGSYVLTVNATVDPLSPGYPGDPPGTYYSPIFNTLDLVSPTPIWITGIQALGDAVTYPFDITAAWFGLSGSNWQPNLTIRSDPDFTYTASGEISLYLEYTIYYMYQ